MSSAAQVLANRENSARSTGPVTAEGKAASSKNSTRHGLSGAFTILLHERREEFDQLAARIRSELQPQGEDETFLVDRMIQSRWSLARIQRLEDLAYEQILTEPGSATDPDARLLAALTAQGNPVEKLQRYVAAAERTYFKALRELESGRLRNHTAEAKMLANYVTKVIYAPVPGEQERSSFNAAVHAHMRNEANRIFSTPPTS